MVRNRSKWFRSTMSQSRFSSISYSTLSQGTDNLDHAAVANEFVSKRNATLPCCADEISQNLRKELFFSLINNHHKKVHPAIFFRKQLFDPPPTNSVPPLHQTMGMTKVGGLIKRFCPLPPPTFSPPTNEILCRGPCALLNVTKVETLMSRYYFSIFEYWIGCSSLYSYIQY